MNNCCFIIPYFGKLPNYFQLFLNSCGYNKDYNWLLFTDDSTPYIYPLNVKRIITSFEDISNFIKSKFDFPIQLPRPYKFCDFRPMYGYIFEDYLKDFDWWGYCDVDIVFGNISSFISEEILQNYDKVFCLGHFTIIKNTRENNSMFKNSCDVDYKDILQSVKAMVFDEDGQNQYNINKIFIKCGKSVFLKDYSFNINLFNFKFIKVTYDGIKDVFINESYKPAIYLWSRGKIVRFYKETNEIKQEEFLYIHLQGRKMEIVDNTVFSSETFQIMPNQFKSFSHNVSISSFNNIEKFGTFSQYYRMSKLNLYINRLLHPINTYWYLYYKYIYK